MLVSNMNDNGYISIQLLINFFYNVLPNLTVEDVIESLSDSTVVIVDPATQMVRPNITVERKTIILRDIPENTTEEDIASLLSSHGNVESVKQSIGNNW